MATTKAAIVVIGDEILKGQVVDTNSHFLLTRLHALGVRVVRMTVVPDEVSAIAEEVARVSQYCDLVFTCGGIGPTHDDVTYEGVAKALGEELIFFEGMAKAMKSLMGARQAGKMAQIPSSSTLIRSPKCRLPVVRAGNIFIFPGIPAYCQMAFDVIQDTLIVSPVQFFTQEVRIQAGELAILPALNDTVDRYLDKVSLGSYPYETSEGHWHSRVTLESTSIDDVCNARADLLAGLAPGLADMSLTAADAKLVMNLARGSTPFAKVVDGAIKVIEEALTKFSPEEVVLSFNGGKDCTVLLHLVWAVSVHQDLGAVNTLYVRSADPFPEIAAFIDDCEKRYSLTLETLPGPIRPALESLVAKRPNVKAVWMGTRRSDPFSYQHKPFQMCDPGWPQVTRISPLLDWSYHDVWNFLRCLAVPYCSLYDQGYTSLGDRSNTAPNPVLLDKLTQKYKPAYALTNGDLERNGRQ